MFEQLAVNDYELVLDFDPTLPGEFDSNLAGDETLSYTIEIDNSLNNPDQYFFVAGVDSLTGGNTVPPGTGTTSLVKM